VYVLVVMCEYDMCVANVCNMYVVFGYICVGLIG